MNVRSLLWVGGLSLVFLAISCQAAPVQPTPNPMPTPTPIPLPKEIGRPMLVGDTAVYRMMEDGRLRHIADMSTYLALGYQPHDVAPVASTRLRGFLLALPLTRWLTGQQDHALYFLDKSQRYQITDLATLHATGGSPLDVSPVADDFLNSFPITTDPILSPGSPASLIRPSATAALWSGGALWTARSDGTLTRLEPARGQFQQVLIPSNPVITALIEFDSQVYAATQDGAIWQITSPDQAVPIAASQGSRLSALAASRQDLWYADVNTYDVNAGAYHVGRGLIRRDKQGNEKVYTLDVSEHDPLRNITALVVDAQQNKLWIGTRFAGLIGYDLTRQTWERHTTFNSLIPDNRINDLKLAPDGALWLAMPSGVVRFRPGEVALYSIPDDVADRGASALAIGSDGKPWVAGENFVAQLTPEVTPEGKPRGNWQMTSAFDAIDLLDWFRAVVLDDQGRPWFIGDQHHVYRGDNGWTVYDAVTYQGAPLILIGQPGDASGLADSTAAFPSPQTDYQGWLQAWPRPKGDNGRGLHYLTTPTGEPFELQVQIERLKRLGVHWAVVNYPQRSHLLRMARAFAEAGIMVIWRPFIRPYETYDYWEKDVGFLRALGIPPYIQVYNEPSLGQEWEDAKRPIDQAVYLSHLLPAVKQVYQAGGYVGLQELDPEWLRAVLREFKKQNMTDIFQRMFFVPHAYGYNHPPEFDQDPNGVLGFRTFAQVFQTEIGFVPVMIAGEGGWRPGEAQDTRYPMVTQTRHRDYLLAVFNWFRSGKLSNGEALPDYLLAFCPWILSDPSDPAAWFDSASGNRILVIQAVQNLPAFERKFSWERP